MIENLRLLVTGRYRISVVIALLILAGLIQSYHLTKPWIGFGEADGAIIGHIARNWVRYGFIAVKFGSATNSGPVVNNEFTYYVNHPLVLFNIFISLSYRVLGVHEWSARLVPIAFSLGSLAVLYLLVRRFWDDTVAIWSLTFMAIMPLTGYYGRNVSPHSMAVFFGLLMFWFYFSWLKSGRKRDFLYLIISQVFATMSAWGAYYVAVLLLIHCMLTNRKRLKGVLLLPVMNVVMFLLFLAHVYLVDPGSGLVRLAKVFLLRSNIATPGAFDWLKFFEVVLQTILTYFSIPLSLLAFVGLYSFLAKGRHRDSRHLWVILLLLWGSAEILLFRQATISAGEIIYFYYFGPFFAVSGALGLVFLKARLSNLKRVGAIVLVCILSLFVAQSIFALYNKLYNPSHYGFEYGLARAINQNTKFDEAVIISLNPLHYYLPYYADRYFKHNVRTEGEFLQILRDHSRRYRYFITTTPALAQRLGLSPDSNSTRNIHELDTNLDRYLVEKYPFVVKDDWLIFFDLTIDKTKP